MRNTIFLRQTNNPGPIYNFQSSISYYLSSDLSTNKITAIENGTFANLNALTYLYFSSVNINKIISFNFEDNQFWKFSLEFQIQIIINLIDVLEIFVTLFSLSLKLEHLRI